MGVVPLGLYAVLGSPNVPDQPAHHLDAADAVRLAELTRQLEDKPDDPALWVEVARLHTEARQWDKAEAAWRGALLLSPGAPMVQLALAEVLVQQAGGMVGAEAVRFLQSALELMPDNRTSLYYLGLAAAQQQDDRTALMYWDTLAKVLPETDPAYPAFVDNYRLARERLEKAGH